METMERKQPRRRRSFTPGFKAEIVERCRAGDRTIGQVARDRPADVWFEPGLVLEILSAELTLLPNCTAGLGQVKEQAGLAMRFPRFTGRWRDDKPAGT